MEASSFETPTETSTPTSTRTFGQTVTADAWQLDIFVENFTRAEDGAALSTTIVTGGKFSGELRGVKCQILDENESVIREAVVGDVPAGEIQWINTTIPESARFLVLRVDEVYNPDGDYEASVRGLEFTAEGEIRFRETQGKENFTY